MKPVLILGAGKIGSSIAKLLFHTGDYDVTLVDCNHEALDRIGEKLAIKTFVTDITNVERLKSLLKDKWVVVSACSYHMNKTIAEAALACGVSYFDLTEDVETTKHIRSLAKGAVDKQIFLPQCGLAPGFIGILAYDLCQQFDEIDTIKMRVGALPQFPTNKMMYNLTWSTDGLINEYANPCEEIRLGKQAEAQPLEGLEKFSLDGMEYEAFNTSGGLGTLCETLRGKVKNLNYKTVRYKGHQYLADFLINELQLGEGDRRELLKKILETAVPITRQDVVLVFVSVTGMKRGQFTQVSDARKIYDKRIRGEHWSSIQVTTAAGLCTLLDLHAEGKLPASGFVKQEDVALDSFIKNRFGQYYKV